MWERLKEIFKSPRPPKIEEKIIVCPQCKRLHTTVHINNKPLGGTKDCDECISERMERTFERIDLIMDELEEWEEEHKREE